MISPKLYWASARSATPGSLHKTSGASRTSNHHCPVQTKAVVESRGVRDALSWCHDMPLGYDGTSQQWCVASMQQSCCSVAEWHFGDGMKTKCHGSILLSFRVEQSVAIWQSRQLFGLKIYVKEKKRKNKTKQPNQLCLGPHYTLLLRLEKRCQGPDTEWENHFARKLHSEKIFVPYLSNVKWSQYHQQGTQSLLSPISTSPGFLPVTARSRTRSHGFVLCYLFCWR